uniref:Uncharacterized protein n=1 Tax=Panagrolaimus sp. JU765 TaxID=591449 RepID=A0AC34RHU2_9BILA
MWDNEYQEEIQNLINGNDALFDNDVEFYLMVNYEIIPVKTAVDVTDELLKIKQGYFNEIPIAVAIQMNYTIPQFEYDQPLLSRLNFLAALILFKYYGKTDFPHQSNAIDFQEITNMIPAFAIDIMENCKSIKGKVDQLMISLIKLRQWSFKQIKRNENLDEFELQFTNCTALLDTIAKKDDIFQQDYHHEDSPYDFAPFKQEDVPSTYDSSNRQPAPPSREDMPLRHEDTFVHSFPPENTAANYTAEDQYVIASLSSLIEAFHEDYWKSNVKIINQDQRHFIDIINEVCEHSNFFLKRRPLHKLKERVDDFMFSLKSLKTEIENVIIAEAAFGKYKEFLADCEATLQVLFNQNILPAQKAWLRSLGHEKGPTRLRMESEL